MKPENEFRLRMLTAPLRAWPHFIIIGAQRSGTSSLFHMLKRHPQIKKPIVNEIHFFDNHYQRGTWWYRAHFARRKTLRQARHPRVTFDKTPFLLFSPEAPRRVAETLPDVRLVVLLRNPVDRALSNFRKAHQHGLEKIASFEEAIAAEPERLRKEAEAFERGEITQRPHYRRRAYVARGKYDEYLADWFEHFDRSQFFIRPSEELFDDPVTVTNDLARWLGLRPFPARRQRKFRNVNATPSTHTMRAETRTRLEDLYRPHVERLERLVGRQFSWFE